MKVPKILVAAFTAATVVLSSMAIAAPDDPTPPVLNIGGAEARSHAQLNMQEMARLLKGCTDANTGQFDGKLLYGCVFNISQLMDLALIDGKKRSEWKAIWEHKHDNDGMLNQPETAVKAINEMVHSLGELHTTFFSQKQLKAFTESFLGTMNGIGAPVYQLGTGSVLQQLGLSEDKAAWEAASKIGQGREVIFWPGPIPGTPAEKAGIQKGDQIVAIDDKPVAGMNLDQVVALIRGEPSAVGTNVKINVKRGTGMFAKDVALSVTRQQLDVPMLTSSVMDGDFGYWKLTQFGSKKLHITFAQAIGMLCTGKEFPSDGNGGITFGDYDADRDCHLQGGILDFRANPGGDLKWAEIIPQFFMDHGPLITTLNRNGDEIMEERIVLEPDFLLTEHVANGVTLNAKSDNRYPVLFPKDKPLVVLIDEHSASASEIVAGLLQVNKRAIIVGEPSFGKEVGQQLMPLAFGTGFKPTTFRFKPGGEDLGVAVIPDVPYKQSLAYVDDPRGAHDEQLEKAFEVLRNFNKEALHRKAIAETVKERNAARDARYWKRFQEQDAAKAQ